MLKRWKREDGHYFEVFHFFSFCVVSLFPFFLSLCFLIIPFVLDSGEEGEAIQPKEFHHGSSNSFGPKF